MSEILLQIDGRDVKVSEGMTVLEAAQTVALALKFVLLALVL